MRRHQRQQQHGGCVLVSASASTDSGWTAATTSGFTTTAGSSDLYHIAVPADQIGETGYAYARLKAVESVDSAVPVASLPTSTADGSPAANQSG